MHKTRGVRKKTQGSVPVGSKKTLRRAVSSFLLESGGLPQYFASMLSDVDRARKYHDALVACLAEWRCKHVGDPLVLDLGTGTGLLTYLVLSIDPRARVLAVDTNRSALDLASQLIAKENPEYMHRVTFLQASANEVPSQAVGAVDILVSEILGTFTTSELAHTFVDLYMRHALKDRSAPYVVPQTTVQYLAIHKFIDMPSSMWYALDAATQTAASVGLYCPTGNGGLGVLLDAYPSQRVAYRVVRCEQYDTCPMQASAPKTVNMLAESVHAPSNRKSTPSSQYVSASLSEAQLRETSQCKNGSRDRCLSVLEWEACLWGDVRLCNTLEGYRDLRRRGDILSVMSRNSAWGFFVAPYTTDLSTRFSPNTGSFVVRYRSPFSPQPSGTFELFGPFMDHDSHDDADDASSSISIQWVRHVADADMSARLANLACKSIADSNGAFTRIVVWNDPACGETAVATRRALNGSSPVRVECVYSAGSAPFSVARRVCASHEIPVSLAVNRCTRRGEPLVSDSTTMFIAPMRLVCAERDGLEAQLEAHIMPTLKKDLRKSFISVAFPSAMQTFGLDVVGSAAICTASSLAPVHICETPFFAFLEECRSKSSIQMVIEESELPQQFPTASLENIWRLAAVRDWQSLYARILAARECMFHFVDV